jgi:hypothetical protein
LWYVERNQHGANLGNYVPELLKIKKLCWGVSEEMVSKSVPETGGEKCHVNSGVDDLVRE